MSSWLAAVPIHTVELLQPPSTTPLDGIAALTTTAESLSSSQPFPAQPPTSFSLAAAARPPSAPWRSATQPPATLSLTAASKPPTSLTAAAWAALHSAAFTAQLGAAQPPQVLPIAGSAAVLPDEPLPVAPDALRHARQRIKHNTAACIVLVLLLQSNAPLAPPSPATQPTSSISPCHCSAQPTAALSRPPLPCAAFEFAAASIAHSPQVTTVHVQC